MSRDRTVVVLALLVTLFVASPAWGAVTFDASLGADHGVDVSLDNTGLTIGVGANTALIVLMTCGNNSSGATPTTVTINWDQDGTPQALTQMTGSPVTFSTGAKRAWSSVWYLVNPTTGNKKLHGAWTNANECYTLPSSWFGVDQTTPVINLTSATNASTSTCSVTQSPVAPINDRTLFAALSGPNASVNSTNQDQLHIHSGANTGIGYACGGTACDTNAGAFQSNLSQADSCLAVSVDIQAAAAAVVVTPAALSTIHGNATIRLGRSIR